MRLILASSSMARRKMLQDVGLNFEVIPAQIDESAIINAALADNNSTQHIAQNLADQKALFISQKNPDSVVIGSDQILEHEGNILQKATNPQQAREKLEKLRGKTHFLSSAVSVCKNGIVVWQHVETARMTMNRWNQNIFEAYIQNAGEVLTSCVGAYAIEGPALCLFEKIEGDYFTVLGMPLLPLLNYLQREQ